MMEKHFKTLEDISRGMKNILLIVTKSNYNNVY